MTSTVVTLASVPAIIALINLLKNLGLSGKWSALVAVVLGGVFAVVDYLVTANPISAAPLWGAACQGVILGLSASGLYDLSDKIAKPIAKTARAASISQGLSVEEKQAA